MKKVIAKIYDEWKQSQAFLKVHKNLYYDLLDSFFLTNCSALFALFLQTSRNGCSFLENSFFSEQFSLPELGPKSCSFCQENADPRIWVLFAVCSPRTHPNWVLGFEFSLLYVSWKIIKNCIFNFLFCLMFQNEAKRLHFPLFRWKIFSWFSI